EIRREGVVVVADARLARTSEAAAIVGDHAVTGRQQRGGLFFPRRSAQRPSVDEHDRRPGTVIFVIELDGGGVLLTDRDGAHAPAPSSGRCPGKGRGVKL